MSDADRDALARHRAGLEDLTIGALASRLRALYDRPAPTAEGMAWFHRVNCLTTPNDPLIDHDAAKLWGLWVETERFRHITVKGAAGHTAMFEYQQEWLEAFKRCFDH